MREKAEDNRNCQINNVIVRQHTTLFYNQIPIDPIFIKSYTYNKYYITQFLLSACVKLK